MNWHEAITDRRFNIGLCIILSVLFGAAAFVTESWWGAAMMMWASGAQFGLAAMWFISPVVRASWQRRMEAEIAIMTAAVFARILRESYDIEPDMTVDPPTPPTTPMH